jgi:membrane protease YdiL (CAAX protease family)
MVVENLPTDPPETKNPETWVDLALYIFGGFGLFVVASGVVGYFFMDIEPNLLLLTLAVLLNVVFLGGSVYILGILRGKVSWRELGVIPLKFTRKWFWWAFGLTIILLPIRGLIGYAVQILIEGNLDSLQARADLLASDTTFSWPAFLVTLVGAGILGPISEELYFRGLIHRWFIPRLSLAWRVLISSLFFGLGHIDSIAVLIASFIMGVVLAIVYEKTESLWVPIAMHIFTNSIAVVALYASLAISQYFPS